MLRHEDDSECTNIWARLGADFTFTNQTAHSSTNAPTNAPPTTTNVPPTAPLHDEAIRMRCRITRRSEIPETAIVENKIVFLNTDDSEIVNAPTRLKIFASHFGTNDTYNKQYSSINVVNAFKDLSDITDDFCLVHDKKIRSGTQWFCKNTSIICNTCKKKKIYKQIGAKLKKTFAQFTGADLVHHQNHRGGAPRCILSIAERLTINHIDYRNLSILFNRLSDIGISTPSSLTLWQACSTGTSCYLTANKRFVGCLMAIGHRPITDHIKFAASKRLANLWHPINIWKAGRYLTFSQSCTYTNGDKTEERALYDQDVLSDSARHVETALQPLCWHSVAHAAWDELVAALQTLSEVSHK